MVATTMYLKEALATRPSYGLTFFAKVWAYGKPYDG